LAADGPATVTVPWNSSGRFVLVRRSFPVRVTPGAAAEGVSVNSRWPAASLPPYAPGITGSAPISHVASASESVFEAIEYVVSAVLVFFGTAAAGSAGSRARKGAERGHWAGIGPPSIHVRTDWSAHPDG